ncbi:hypothetical protein BKA93DRAFT_828480 [Sparassis latifolia]
MSDTLPRGPSVLLRDHAEDLECGEKVQKAEATSMKIVACLCGTWLALILYAVAFILMMIFGNNDDNRGLQ